MPDPKKGFKVRRKGKAYTDKSKNKPIGERKTSYASYKKATKAKPAPEPRIKPVQLDGVTVVGKRKSAPSAKKRSTVKAKPVSRPKTSKVSAKSAGVKTSASKPKASAHTKVAVAAPKSKLRQRGEKALAAGKLGKARRLARKYHRKNK